MTATPIRAIRGAVLAMLLVGCVRPSAGYQCTSDTQCSGGTCEQNGYCSFADLMCTSGRRYGDHSGPVSNQCVGDTTPMADASVTDDMSMIDIDAGPDAAPVMPTFLAQAHSNAGAVASLTYAFDVPVGANYLLVSVQLASDCNNLVPDVTSVKFNNASLARFATITGTPCGMATTRSDQWGLVAPPTGAHDVVVTLAAAAPNTIHSGAMAFAGVHQITPVRASATARAGNNDNTISVMVASAPYDLVIETAGTGGNFNNPGMGQTMVFRNNASSGNTLDNSAASTKPGAAGMVTVSWSVGLDESQEIASSLRPL